MIFTLIKITHSKFYNFILVTVTWLLVGQLILILLEKCWTENVTLPILDNFLVYIENPNPFN